MARPVLFVLDDDTGVMFALREDLSRRFSLDFRVVGESSAAAGLAKLRRLAKHGERVALLIVDHQMTELPGLLRRQRAQLAPIAAGLTDRLQDGTGLQRTLALWRSESISATLRFLDAAGQLTSAR